jgi:hypothetical protein
VKYGKRKSGEVVISALHENRRTQVQSSDINYLLSKDCSPLFFDEINNIVKREWELMENLFCMDKSKVTVILDELNVIGRPDAHAKLITNDEFTQIRLYLSAIEKVIHEWQK